jgi:large subunit ribosomal protein L2
LWALCFWPASAAADSATRPPSIFAVVKAHPVRALCSGLRTGSGRSHGRLVLRRRGSGHQRLGRRLDLVRCHSFGEFGLVKRLEHDPSRTSPICLAAYSNGVLCYIIPSQGLRPGSPVANVSAYSSRGFLGLLAGSMGFSYPLSLLPTGSLVHCIQSSPEAVPFARAAGSSGQVLRFLPGDLCLLRLRSGGLVTVKSCFRATSGRVAGSLLPGHRLSAGWSRRRGRRPKVRGVAMNAVDHPHGGGEGRGSAGRPSTSPWGYLCKSGFRLGHVPSPARRRR